MHTSLIAMILTGLASGSLGAASPMDAVAPVLAASVTSPSSQAQHVQADLIADVASISPGKTFRLGVRFRIDPHWHIYWRYSGETGQPTEVRWKLPEEFRAGPLQYPGPRKFVDKADIVSYGYEDQVLLWSEITPPKDLTTGQKVTLGAEANWLACKTLCVMGSASLSLELPVEAKPSKAKGEALASFEAAERQLPVEPEKAKHLDVKTKLSVDAVRPGQEFKALVRLDIEKGWHIQSNKPLDENMIATDLFLGATDALRVGRPVFPKGTISNFAGMKVSEYAGTVQVEVPLRATNDLQPGRHTIEGVLVYQACKEDGTCLPPEYVSLEIPVRSGKASTTASAPPSKAAPSQGPESANGVPEESAAQPGPTTMASTDTSVGGTGSSSRGLIYLLLVAFGGGLLLNVMPCVLPVVSIKIVSFVQQAGEEPRRVLLLGVAFTGGMLSFFVLLGVLAMQVPIGPGWVLQSTVGTVVLIAVIFAFALSLFGVFEITLPGSAASGLTAASASKEGPVGAWLKGFLTTILGTSCTAPLLSAAWTGAIAMSPPVRLLIFVVMGFGMASPYLVLSAKPGWMKFLPKPGAWMDAFKQFMGFLLIATAIWLMWVLSSHVGADGVVWTLALLTAIAMALWLVGRVSGSSSMPRTIASYAAAVVLIAGASWWIGGILKASEPTSHGVTANADGSADFSDSIPWRPYEKGLAQKLANEGKVVYVDYTARWCATCQSNKRLVLDTEEVRSVMERLGVVPLKADFTRGDASIKEDLARFNRPSVPLNLVYGPRHVEDPIVLPELLTKERVLDALRSVAQARNSGQDRM